MIKYIKNKSETAYGFGRLDELEDYLIKNYGENPIFIRGNILDLPDYSMSHFDRNKKHCSLTAITRILHYYSLRGYDNIPNDEKLIYDEVKNKAKKILAYNRFLGTFPFRISHIFKSMARSYGYNFKAKGVYSWSFSRDIRKEIDQARPLVFNIMRGHYRKHSVSLVGYKIYSIEGNPIEILIIQDGWRKGLSFLDFSQFKRNLAWAGLGSFNKLEILSKP